jgi:Ca2+-binding RTX toxin-like protein
MVAYDYSLVQNTTVTFNPLVDTINFGALSAGSFTVTEITGGLTLRNANGTSITLNGASLATVSNTNFTFGSGTTASRLFAGDLSSAALTDEIGNTINTTLDGATNNNNLIYGLGGNDTVTATGTGNQIIFGGSGADALNTGNGNNTIYGGNGIADSTDEGDNITIGGGASFVYSNAGNDSVTAATASSGGTKNTLFLGLGNDTFAGAAATHAGNFEIAAGTGADLVQFDTTGDITIYGGNGSADSTDGNDTITGDASNTGNTTIYGNSGNDTITTGATASAKTVNVFAGLGDDTITSGASASGSVVNLYGNTGADSINASAALAGSTVTIYGGNGISDSTDGNDTITSGLGTTTIYANAGNDVVNVINQLAASVAVVYTGLGNDTVNVGNGGANAGAASVTVHLASGNQTVNYDGAISGGAANLLSITGFDATADVLAFDMSAGTAANLLLSGGFLFNDVNSDGAYQVATEEAVNLSGFTGNFSATNILLTSGGIGGASVGRLLTNVNGTTAATLTGGTTNDYFVSGSLADTIVASTGGDKIQGGGGNDVFQFAGSAFTTADTITGGDGTDTIQFTADTGGALADAIWTNTLTVETLLLNDIAYNAGAITLDAQADEAGLATINASALTGTNAINIVLAGTFNNTLTFTGGAGADTMNASGGTDAILIADGGAGNDIITGDGAADSITGGAGVDTLIGGAGIDTISGGEGADIISGGAGGDVLTGGNGADVFRLRTTGDSSVANLDKISSFVKADDGFDFDLTSDAAVTNDATVVGNTANEFSAGVVVGTLATNVAAAGSLTAALTLVENATIATGEVAVFTYGGNTYIIQEDAGNNNGSVHSITELTGITGITNVTETTNDVLFTLT